MIKTADLHIRPTRVEDIGEVYISALNDKSIVGNTEAVHRSWNFENVSEYVKSCNYDHEFPMLIGAFDISSGEHIGNLRISGVSKVHKFAEIGFIIHNRAYWGKGLGTQFVGAVCSWLFEEKEIRKICADYHDVNKASARLFEKLGFSVEGVFKEHFMVDGRIDDSIRVALLNKNYSK